MMSSILTPIMASMRLKYLYFLANSSIYNLIQSPLVVIYFKIYNQGAQTLKNLNFITFTNFYEKKLESNTGVN